MGYTLTSVQKRLLADLLKVGRWNNESEIIRYGLHLVTKEVEAEQVRNLEAYPTVLLRQAYERLSATDREEEKAMTAASAGPGNGELE